MKDKKICLIGYGYWGKILHKNILKMGFRDVTILDEVLENMNSLTGDFDYYFVATPFTSHKNLLNKISKFKGKRIWCEKPLVESYQDLASIYKKMESNNNLLFVDWIYLYNPAIEFIAKKIQGRGIKQVILNRTNDGPVRTDCSSIWDLSSHDLSIIFSLFGIKNYEFEWKEFSLKTHEKTGSNVSWSYLDGIQIIINSSWQHQNKNRVSIFITNDDEIIVFDDTKKTVTLNGEEIADFTHDNSPLEYAMEFFMNADDFSHNRKITEAITLEITGYNANV
jgi:predicted dehydrogenase